MECSGFYLDLNALEFPPEDLSLLCNYYVIYFPQDDFLLRNSSVNDVLKCFFILQGYFNNGDLKEHCIRKNMDEEE